MVTDTGRQKKCISTHACQKRRWVVLLPKHGHYNSHLNSGPWIHQKSLVLPWTGPLTSLYCSCSFIKVKKDMYLFSVLFMQQKASVPVGWAPWSSFPPFAQKSQPSISSCFCCWVAPKLLVLLSAGRRDKGETLMKNSRELHKVYIFQIYCFISNFSENVFVSLLMKEVAPQNKLNFFP